MRYGCKPRGTKDTGVLLIFVTCRNMTKKADVTATALVPRGLQRCVTFLTEKQPTHIYIYIIHNTTITFLLLLT